MLTASWPAVTPAFQECGYTMLPALLDGGQCARLAALAQPGQGRAGTRNLLAQPWCADLVGFVREHAAVAPYLQSGCVAVQCTLFEKSAGQNWLVPMHQDLSIPVAARVDTPQGQGALRGWSTKEGRLFVQAPRQVLEQMLALRIHLDPCTPGDGPLRVVPGSHRHGILTAGEAGAADALRSAGGEAVCSAQAGDALLLRPLLLHASSKSTGNSRRRVLHVVFGPGALPFGLHWAHRI